MDKINIKFVYNDYEYCYRVPKNFLWFQMYRVKKITNNFALCEYLVYNEGKIIQDGFMISKAGKESNIIDYSYRTEKQEESVLYSFIKDLIINKGKNDITLRFANKLNVNVDEVFSYDYSKNINEFFNSMFEDINNEYNIKKNVIMESENILNYNPYKVLGIEEKEYSKEELSNIFNSKMNFYLDAYNRIKKENENKILKR